MKKNNTIADFCKKIGITEAQFNGTEKITGYLYLRGLTSIPEGFKVNKRKIFS